jgi:hypothetical protein
VIRITTGGLGSPGGPPVRRRRRLLGLGLVIALAIGLPTLMVGGVEAASWEGVAWTDEAAWLGGKIVCSR